MEYEYNFSVIIAAYNTQGYLNEAVDSVINQSIGFKKNVELIIVDDGSLDNTFRIAREYEKKYPNNIKAFTQNHNGTASARNNGLKHATGKYINFLDSDDYLSSNALKEVFNFFEEKYEETDIVSIPMFYFDEITGTHPLNYKHNKIAVIDLEKNPNNPQLSISSSFIKNEAIKEKEFKENLLTSEDTLLLNQILLNKKKLGVIKNAKYYYRKRYSSNSLTDNAIFNKEYYVPRLKEYFQDLIDYNIKKTGKLDEFIQYTIIYDLQKIIKQENLDINEIEDNENEFYELLRKIVSKLDNKVILTNKNINDLFLKNYMYYLKRDDLHPEYPEDKSVQLRIDKRLVDTLHVHKFWIKNVSIINGNIVIEGEFSSYFNTNHLSIEAIVTDYNENTESYKANLDTDLENSHRFLSKPWQYKTIFKIEIPLNENTKERHVNDIDLKINYHKNQDNTDFDEDNLISTNLAIDFKEKAKNFKNNEDYVKDKFLVSFKNQQFHTTQFLFKYSVVMAVYNTEDYLAEAIESVINQTLDFKENIELVIVNDGSTDSSEEIAFKYQKQYPENIQVLSQENAGQSSARNNGIEHARGRYINFLDSDDYLGENVIEEVNKFLEEHPDECDVIALPIMQFERFDGPHGLNYKFEETRIIDLIEEPDNPQLHVSSSFIESNILRKYRFDTRLISSEDANILNKVLLNKNKLGVISNAYYYYRRRTDNSSTIDTMNAKKEHFTIRLKYHFMEMIDFCISKYSEVPTFIQYTLLYDLHWLIYETDDLTEVFDNEYEIEEFYYYLKNIMKYIDVEVIFNNVNVKNRLLCSFLLAFKSGRTKHLLQEDTVLVRSQNKTLDNLKNHTIWLDIVNIENNTMYLSGFLNSLFEKEFISIQAVKYNCCNEEDINIEKSLFDEENEYYVAKYVNYTSRRDRMFVSKKWQHKYNFDIEIPLKEEECSNIFLVVNYHIDANPENHNRNDIIRIPMNTSFKGHARLSEISNYLINENHILSFNDNIFSIRNYSYGNMIKSEMNVLSKLIDETPHGYLEALKIRILHLILYPFFKNKEIDFYMDRIDVADDNATYLFEYANKQNDDIKKYMLVSNDCTDFKRISKIGNVLNHNGFKNKLYALFAKKVISTHPYESQFNPFFDFDKEKDKRPLYAGLFNPKIYFLQHGVTLGNISSWMSKFDHNVSLIVTVSDEEKESFKKDGYNYDENIVQTLGFPRYDKLTNNREKIILLIPTWRKNLRASKELFINSEYFEKLNEILSDDTLIEKLMDNGYKILFKPHPELEKPIVDSDEIYTDLFDIHPNIIISREETYNELFKKSSILITDYSSVFFDFAYLKKPVIYYHPSDDYHYDESYFNFETMGFGDVVNLKEDLISKIDYYIENDCELEDKYKERVDSFFKYTDKNNCKRVYDWIKEH